MFPNICRDALYADHPSASRTSSPSPAPTNTTITPRDHQISHLRHRPSDPSTRCVCHWPLIQPMGTKLCHDLSGHGLAVLVGGSLIRRVHPGCARCARAAVYVHVQSPVCMYVHTIICTVLCYISCTSYRRCKPLGTAAKPNPPRRKGKGPCSCIQSALHIRLPGWQPAICGRGQLCMDDAGKSVFPVHIHTHTYNNPYIQQPDTGRVMMRPYSTYKHTRYIHS